MEFTQLLKKGSAILFVVLFVHGLILGFSVSTTILAVVLASVSCLFEAQLVKSERLEQNERLKTIVDDFKHRVNNLVETQHNVERKLILMQEKDKAELMERIANTDSKIQTIKLNQGIKRL